MKFCTHCGAEILDEAAICTKCGCPVDSTTANTTSKPKLNVLALVGFILSLGSLILYYFGILTAIAGIICSIVGLVQVNRRGERGKGFAIAGISVGAALLAIWIFAFFWLYLLALLIVVI